MGPVWRPCGPHQQEQWERPPGSPSAGQTALPCPGSCPQQATASHVRRAGLGLPWAACPRRHEGAGAWLAAGCGTAPPPTVCPQQVTELCALMPSSIK